MQWNWWYCRVVGYSRTTAPLFVWFQGTGYRWSSIRFSLHRAHIKLSSLDFTSSSDCSLAVYLFIHWKLCNKMRLKEMWMSIEKGSSATGHNPQAADGWRDGVRQRSCQGSNSCHWRHQQSRWPIDQQPDISSKKLNVCECNAIRALTLLAVRNSIRNLGATVREWTMKVASYK